MVRRAILRAVAQDNGVKLRQAVDKMIELAAAGEQWAVKELFDRLDGKAVQQIHATGSALTIVLAQTLEDGSIKAIDGRVIEQIEAAGEGDEVPLIAEPAAQPVDAIPHSDADSVPK